MIPCSVCGQKLYPLERMTLNSKVFHKNGCAKCLTCNTNLTVTNFAMVGEHLFCKTHYMSNFSRSGGRYSFTMESDVCDAAQVKEPTKLAPRPSIAVSRAVDSHRSMPAVSPSASSSSSSAPSKVNKLAVFLASATKNDPAQQSPKAQQQRTSSPIKTTPVKDVAAQAPKRKSDFEDAVVATPAATGSNRKQPSSSANKLTSFLSNAEDVKAPVTTTRKVETEVVERTPRPISLKERIAIYSVEASKAKEGAGEKQRQPSFALPPLPRKDPSLTLASSASAAPALSKRKASGEEAPAPPSRKITTEIPRTPQQQDSRESKLSNFLKTGEIPAKSSSKSLHQSERGDASSTPSILPLKDRLALYANEPTDHQENTVPTKPSTPFKADSPADGFKQRVVHNSEVRGASLQEMPTSSSPATIEARAITLKERIASYQAKASGVPASNNSSNKKLLGKSPLGKTPSLKQTTPTASPLKKSSFRARMPSFLKSSVHAAPKPSELTKAMRKICEDGVAQISRASIKSNDATPEVKALALELLDTFEHLVTRIDQMEDEARRSSAAASMG